MLGHNIFNVERPRTSSVAEEVLIQCKNNIRGEKVMVSDINFKFFLLLVYLGCPKRFITSCQKFLTVNNFRENTAPSIDIWLKILYEIAEVCMHASKIYGIRSVTTAQLL